MSIPSHFSGVAILAFALGLGAQPPAGWHPSPGHAEMLLWPGPVPDAQPQTGPEFAKPGGSLVAGKPWVQVGHVSQPTITVYSPKAGNTGAAVLVFPGGGYQILAIDLEGTEACDWLTSRGLTCVLLKYRVPNSGPHWERGCDCQVNPKAPMALQDAQRALLLVRFHAAQWQVNPRKVGVLGFSAGGHLAAALSNHFDQRLYPALDAADQLSLRPDFAISIYPGHLSVSENSFNLNPDIHVTSQTPPTFLVQNEDDHVDRVEDSLSYYAALKKHNVPVEMHLYAQGGHGFGLRPTKFPATAWPRFVETWLSTIGITSP